jgi:hypothetical protein
MRGTDRGQSTLELVALIAVVAAALASMTIYMKRATMGRMREATDQLGGQFTPLGTRHAITTVTDVERNIAQAADGTVVETIAAGRPQMSNRTGSENVDTPLSGETLF